MALTHTTACRNAIADAVVDLFDVGTTNATGRVIFYLANMTTEVATLDTGIANPMFGAGGASVAGRADGDFTTDWSDESATGNASPIAGFTIVNRDLTEVLRGSVGTSGEDINLSSLTVAATDKVVLTSLTYTAPV